ncbi:MAG: DUF4493 domain-containing protein [Muribaculaceae bacterium]|nr:DUF4493 domain-containing protein [Muribaculaceae bacterium]
MKTKFITSAVAVLTLGALCGCDDAWDYGDNSGEGKLVINTSVRGDVAVASRTIDSDYLSEHLLLWISNSKGLVREYEGAANVPSGIGLVADHYTLNGWTGDSVPASFDSRFFKGTTDFNIVGGNTTNVDLVCKIANVVTSVKYADAVDEVLKDYTLTVGHLAGKLTFEGRDDRKGYFMLNSRATGLEWTLEGTLLDGTAFSQTGTIDNAQPATEYVLNVKYRPDNESIGGGYFEIEVDETEVEVEDEITIAMAPVIKGLGFDISQPLAKKAGEVGRRSVYVSASAALTSVMVESDVLASLNLGGNDFDLLGMTDEVRAELEAAGIVYMYAYNEIEDISNMKISFEEELLDALTDGNYAFDIKATDANGKAGSAVFAIQISDEPLHTVEVAAADVWATKATLYGNVTQEGATNVMFLYRKRGEQAWSEAAPTESISRTVEYSLELTGLEPSTGYEFTMSCTKEDGSEFISDKVQGFTTSGTPQLPNSGFEDWHKDGKIIMPFAQGGTQYWDTGNHGSSKMNENVTQSATNVKHGGQYSAKLESQFVGIGALGKFAAGNIFFGKYLKTDGTNGVLGWGRSFTARPTALKGYVKYEPKAIDNVAKNAPAEYVKGDMDKGIIYVALLTDDRSTQGDKNYPDFPVVVRTADAHLFQKDAANVIAYGEIIFSEATAGDGMVEFTIPLDYKRTDVIPTYILCTASASKGGDYFTGGPSVMYIDDFELVY